MKTSEAAIVLAKIAAIDNRTVTESAALAWAEALDERMTLDDALEAVRIHRAGSLDYIQPAHVNVIVRKIRHDHTAAAGTPPIPQGLEYEQEQAWRKAWVQAIGEGKGIEWAGIIADQVVPEAIGRKILPGNPESGAAA